MSTVPTPDTVRSKILAWAPVVGLALALVTWGVREYQWAKGGAVGPPPTPPVVAADEAPAPRLAAARPQLGHREHLLATRIAVRLELRKQGHTRADILDALDLLDSDLGPKLLDQAVGDASKATGQTIAFPKPGAFGDGSIVQAILEWFKSPQGQAVIAALIKILLAALGL